MSIATLDTAITAIAGLWEPSTFPAFDADNEYLRGQLELVADTFPFPAEDIDKWEDNQKEYVYDLVAEKLGLNNKKILVSEDMQGLWNHIVNFHRGIEKEDFMASDSRGYTIGQLELFIADARASFDEDIDANDIDALVERLAKDARIA